MGTRILDLGCGPGKELSHLGVGETPELVSCDPLPVFNRQAFPDRRFVQATGEHLPFRAESFESVLCLLSLPYMHIPTALREANRVLIRGGRLFASVHPLSFTWHELRRSRSFGATLYRLFVIVNGIYFHATGKAWTWRGRSESFQTVRGMKKALDRAGFRIVSISRPAGEFGRRLRITAEKL